MSEKINIIYSKKTLCSFPYKPDSTLKDLKNLLHDKYFFSLEDIIFTKNDKILKDDNAKLNSILSTSKNKEIEKYYFKF